LVCDAGRTLVGRPIPSFRLFTTTTGTSQHVHPMLHAWVAGTTIRLLLEGPHSLGGCVLPVLDAALIPFDSSVPNPWPLLLFPGKGEQQVLVRSGTVSSGPWLCSRCVQPCSSMGMPLAMMALLCPVPPSSACRTLPLPFLTHRTTTSLRYRRSGLDDLTTGELEGATTATTATSPSPPSRLHAESAQCRHIPGSRGPSRGWSRGTTT
jgi:hypothetical protein